MEIILVRMESLFYLKRLDLNRVLPMPSQSSLPIGRFAIIVKAMVFMHVMVFFLIMNHLVVVLILLHARLQLRLER